MKKAGSNLLFYIGWVLVFSFTATCTVLLFMRFSPPEAPWLPFAALAAFEYGVINWLHFHKHKARGAMQHTISLVMVVISGLAICAATMLEMVLLLTKQGFVTFPAWVEQTTIFVLIGQIGLNVLAFLAIALTDPDHMAKLRALETDAPKIPTRTIVDALPRSQQPTQHVTALGSEQVSYPALPAGGTVSDPLAEQWTMNGNGGKVPKQAEQ